VHVRLGDVPLRDTAFPHLTMVRQADVEAVLAGALRDRGVEVERGTELLAASQTTAGARATLRTEGRVGEVRCGFVAGCDGAASTVRDAAGIGFPGRAYREEVVLADVELDGELTPGVLHVVAARAGLVFLFALGEGARWRLLATGPARSGDQPFGQPGPPVPSAEVEQILGSAGLGVGLAELRWSARVRLQHRVADSFRSGRLLLAGDAAHVHSPAAAQGMNTGIVDAVGLGWRLAFAVGCGDHDALLDSYDLERRPVARQVRALTDLVFFVEASRHPLPALLRGTLLPLEAPVVPLVVQRGPVMALLLRILSQGWVHYRGSPLSVDGSPGMNGPRPGDRLPDQDVTHEGRRVRLHDLTARPGVHLLLRRDAVAPAPQLLGPHVQVHRISSWPGEGLLAVRPDGHVGFRCAHSDHGRLRAWLDRAGCPAPDRAAEG
jgi:2-polyprenyl-6-methoxyphenol hydroxylase-like FAD-dependent oxidoreductase